MWREEEGEEAEERLVERGGHEMQLRCHQADAGRRAWSGDSDRSKQNCRAASERQLGNLPQGRWERGAKCM